MVFYGVIGWTHTQLLTCNMLLKNSPDMVTYRNSEVISSNLGSDADMQQPSASCSHPIASARKL